VVYRVELHIKITQKNVDRVIQLIRELAYLEPESGAAISVEPGSVRAPTRGGPASYLSIPARLEGLRSGRTSLESIGSKQVGTWGQFNSFFPVKAVLRVLAHMMEENGEKAVDLDDLVGKSIEAVTAAGLLHYRGFPKKVEKESAVGRLVWHFITPAHEMGMIGIEGEDTEIPVKDWKGTNVFLTRQGQEFARLENLILDKDGKEQVLSDAERAWMVKYLKKIDNEGFREYTLLRRIFEQLNRRNTDLAAWLEENRQFIEYVKSWSRKAKDKKRLREQIKNVAAMFAQSKIALLRELGVVRNKRNDYTVIGELG
jgi:hypothetical protein